MLRRFIPVLTILSPMLWAQQVVAPTPEPAGSARGRDVGGYNVVNSFETGYRFSQVTGNLGKYRSDVNYRNGLRLLGSSLMVNSRDGHGYLFDEIILNTEGLGNDPYENATLRIRKNRLYEYDMLWRMNEYYNPALTIANGQHLMDTRHRLQDHDFTLFPGSRLRFQFGYSRSSQTGPALTTTNLFDIRGGEFPLFANIRRQENEYRLGGDFDLAGFRFTLLHRWEYYKEDTPYQLDGAAVGNNGTALSQFQRSEPYHGSTPSWLFNLHTDRKAWAMNGRFTYAGGKRNFIMDESAMGTSRFGAQNLQVLVNGDARRPVTTGDFSFAVFPGDKLSVVNNTSFYNIRIDGNNTFVQFNNSTQTQDVLNFRFLGIRTVTNATDLNYRLTHGLGFYAGYRYSTRRIQSVESFDLPGLGGSRSPYEQNNHLHSGLAGIRLRPVRPLTISLDGEIDRADHPLTPVSDQNYHGVNGRVEYRVKSLVLSTSYRQQYNANSVTLSTYSSRARDYSANVSWVPRDWFAIDAGYSKLHLDTVSGIAFFAGFPQSSLVQGSDSIYISNIHAANLGTRFDIRNRVDLYVGYSITRDTGDGRSSPAPEGVTDPITLMLLQVQAFPLRFESPMARVSIRLNSKIRWNVGWQFYRYREDFGLFGVNQNYRANTGYTSILWSF